MSSARNGKSCRTELTSWSASKAKYAPSWARKIGLSKTLTQRLQEHRLSFSPPSSSTSSPGMRTHRCWLSTASWRTTKSWSLRPMNHRWHKSLSCRMSYKGWISSWLTSNRRASATRLQSASCRGSSIKKNSTPWTTKSCRSKTRSSKTPFCWKKKWLTSFISSTWTAPSKKVVARLSLIL